MTGLFFFGIVKSQPLYFVHMNTLVKCILAGWLIYRFRGSDKIKFNDFDRHACFASGSYILLASFADYFQYFKLYFIR
jgi:hypothetical protein